MKYVLYSDDASTEVYYKYYGKHAFEESGKRIEIEYVNLDAEIKQMSNLTALTALPKKIPFTRYADYATRFGTYRSVEEFKKDYPNQDLYIKFIPKVVKYYCQTDNGKGYFFDDIQTFRDKFPNASNVLEDEISEKCSEIVYNFIVEFRYWHMQNRWANINDCQCRKDFSPSDAYKVVGFEEGFLSLLSYLIRIQNESYLRAEGYIRAKKEEKRAAFLTGNLIDKIEKKFESNSKLLKRGIL